MCEASFNATAFFGGGTGEATTKGRANAKPKPINDLMGCSSFTAGYNGQSGVTRSAKLRLRGNNSPVVAFAVRLGSRELNG